VEAKERVNTMCKLMPFVYPKVQAVNLKEGEPLSEIWDII